MGSRVRTCVDTPILDTLPIPVTDHWRRVPARLPPSSRARCSPETGDPIDDIGYRPLVPADADLLAEFLTTEDWPYHGPSTPSAAQIRQQAAAGFYDNDRTRAFWIITGGAEAGLIRLLDLGDDTPLFDLRIRAAFRGQGLGTRALRWLTRYLFTEFPAIRRIEGTTRQDNLAMRRTFRACGYVKEAHYRQAWPAPGGTAHDAVGYAILRSDWQAGTITPPEWDDEPGPAAKHPPPPAPSTSSDQARITG